jgi:CRP-like cAMP-binding protein
MAIKRRPSFNPKSFLAKVGEGRSIHAYPEAQIVFSQGDSADAVFFLQNGKVKVTVVSKRGKEAVVAILGTNDFFGEGCLIHQEPAFAELFIAHILGRTIRVEADLVDQLFNSSEKRLARLLLLLANFGKEDKPEPLIAKISQETLADMIGTTRSHVTPRTP